MPGDPDVSVILPVLDEAAFIDDVLGDLLQQDYGGRIEVIVADGGSTDGTYEKILDRARSESRVRLVRNPRKRQAFGLNLAASLAGSPILVRADGHSRYAPDYVASSVAALIRLGGAVGGRMNPVGRTRMERAVAAAMRSPLTMGPGRFHHADDLEMVDTVYLGAFAKSDFEALGGFRDFPSGSSEDADFYFRWRLSGRLVHVDPAVHSTYAPRGDLGSLWRQYWRYGMGKSEMRWVNGRFPSRRPLIPVGLVLGLALTLLLGLAVSVWWPLAGLAFAWLAVLGFVGFRSNEAMFSVLLVGAVMHLAYGLGALFGLILGPRRVADLRV